MGAIERESEGAALSFPSEFSDWSKRGGATEHDGRNIIEEKAQAPEGPRAVVGLLFGGWAIFGRNGIGRISTLSSLSYDYNTVLCALLLYQTPSLSPSPSTSQH